MRHTLLMLVFAALVTGSLNANPILSVNFTESDRQITAGTAGVVAAPNWNNMVLTNGDDSIASAILSDGTSPGISVSDGLNDGDGFSSEVAGPTDNDHRLMWYTAGSGTNGTHTIVIDGLTTGFTSRGYDLYVYMHRNQSQYKSVHEISVDLGNDGATTPDPGSLFINHSPSGDFTAFSNAGQSTTSGGAGLGNYVVFSGIGEGIDSLSFTVDAGQRTALNGFQLVAAIPEPTTAALMGVAALIVLARRRRRDSCEN